MSELMFRVAIQEGRVGTYSQLQLGAPARSFVSLNLPGGRWAPKLDRLLLSLDTRSSTSQSTTATMFLPNYDFISA